MRDNGTSHDIVVIGASAGGDEALVHLVSALPAELPATVLIVLHVGARSHANGILSA